MSSEDALSEDESQRVSLKEALELLGGDNQRARSLLLQCIEVARARHKQDTKSPRLSEVGNDLIAIRNAADALIDQVSKAAPASLRVLEHGPFVSGADETRWLDEILDAVAELSKRASDQLEVQQPTFVRRTDSKHEDKLARLTSETEEWWQGPIKLWNDDDSPVVETPVEYAKYLLDNGLDWKRTSERPVLRPKGGYTKLTHASHLSAEQFIILACARLAEEFKGSDGSKMTDANFAKLVETTLTLALGKDVKSRRRRIQKMRANVIDNTAMDHRYLVDWMKLSEIIQTNLAQDSDEPQESQKGKLARLKSEAEKRWQGPVEIKLSIDDSLVFETPADYAQYLLDNDLDLAPNELELQPKKTD